MNLRTLMQAGPAKANELFTRLAETSDGAVKTRERLFAELKAELELHTSLEEQHLFPVLRKNNEKDLVADAIRENRDLQARLDELDALPKNDAGFLDRLKDLQKTFRQHARDEKQEILPAVQRALSEEQVQTVTDKMEAGRAEAEQARQDEADERRSRARQEREQADQEREQEAQQAEAAERTRRAEERRARETAEAARGMAEAAFRPAEIATEQARRTARLVADTAQEAPRAARTATTPLAEMFLWPWMGAMQGLQQAGRAATSAATTQRRTSQAAEEVIPLAEEVLEVNKRTVNRGTARIHRTVVETPVEQQVTLVSERVVVERRKPVGETPRGEVLTDVTLEVTETEEVPMVNKRVRLREEIVVRTERTERVETVQETLRRDEVDIQQPGARRRTAQRQTEPQR